MACNSDLRNWPDSNEFKVPDVRRSNGLFVNHVLSVKNVGLDGCTDVDELRALFDQVLSCFLKKVSVKSKVFRPFPPKLGNGQEADLFKLFLTIRRIGSYEAVSENNLWEFVARECGVDIRIVASLKLIYIKYLKELDQWLLNGGFKDWKMESMEISVVEKLDRLSRQLGRSLIDVEIIRFEDCAKKNEGISGFDKIEGGMNLDDDDEKFSVRDDKRCELSPKFVKKVGFSMVNDEVKRNEMVPESVMKMRLSMLRDDDDVNVGKKANTDLAMIDYEDDDDDDVMVTANDNVINQKRKREEESLQFSEMLDWIANAARDPRCNGIGTSQRSNKLKNYESDQIRKQALLARGVLFAELNVDSTNEACGSQKKTTQKMHPSMYEDDKVQLRCSRRATTAIPSPLKRQQTEHSNIPKDRIREITEPHGQDYNLGPRYQAQVPPWTGAVSDSNPKWLGTRMWPPPDCENENIDLGIGIGRDCSCECVFPRSAECVRFHIAENRLKVKHDIGQLFYKWKFNQMGEEVSLSWEPEEEKRFKSIVISARFELENSKRSRLDIMNKFWKKVSDLIPDKLKENVVSYYFNVFVIRRRSYQNRVTPKEIDSDNDEEEVGSVGDRFGYEKIHGMSLKCSQNMQCTELES